MAPPRIAFRDVRKSFRLRNRSDSLRDAVPRALRRLVTGKGAPAERFVALDHVSFDVNEGEVVGIIGANGAGKSTSLRLAAGIYRPDSGQIDVRGRVSALIELRAGFHPDLSGRENIFLVGALLGLRTRQVADVLDQIADFADIGQFLDSPVRMYSTGMAVRLGFAVAAHVPADIMLVDEVLAVGDVDFQSKCLRRLSERRDEGLSVLFVSHNLEVIEKFCERVVLIHKGRVVEDGPPRQAIATFRRLLVSDGADDSTGQGLAAGRRRRGTQALALDEVTVGGGDDVPANAVAHGGRLTVHATWTASESIRSPRISLEIHTVEGLLCARVERPTSEGAPEVWEGSGSVTVEIPRVDLLPGAYDLSLAVHDASGLAVLDQHYRLHALHVVGEVPDGHGGAFRIPTTWSFSNGRED